MEKKDIELTRGEETIMELFWNAGYPLTSMELSGMTDEFNFSYVHRLINSLLNKEMIEVQGMVKSGKQYARTFLPTMTREQYGAIVMRGLGITDEKALANVAVALICKPAKNDKERRENLIKELEKIIKQLEQE
jgi:BlaI family penicillinase repressor